MSTSFEQRLEGELEQFIRDGVYKRLNYLDSPQGPRVRMEGRGEVIILSSNNYLGLSNQPEVVAAGQGRARALGRRHRLGAVHLRHVHRPPDARGRVRPAGRHRRLAQLRERVERQRGGPRHAARRAGHRDQRPAQPCLDHRRGPAREVDHQVPDGGLPARRPRRPRGEAHGGARPADAHGDHRRCLFHGRLDRPAARPGRALPSARGRARGRRLPRHRRPGRARPRHRRALRPRRRGRPHHLHPRQGARRRGGRVRGRDRPRCATT